MRQDDVMAHVHTFGVVAPEAAGIIQWASRSSSGSVLMPQPRRNLVLRYRVRSLAFSATDPDVGTATPT